MLTLHRLGSKAARLATEHDNQREGMLIRVLLKDHEGVFNADCQIDYLLDAIKHQHGLQRATNIDLCTPDGELKNISIHGDQNGASFFEPRELCLVVAISEVDGHPYYTPTLPDYANNELFVGMLNHKTELEPCSIRLKGKHRQQLLQRTNTPIQANPSKSKSGSKGQRKRRLSSSRVI